MRLVLTVLLFIWPVVATHAQSDAFNPYQAVRDAMPLAQAEPLIAEAYGPIGERYAGIGRPYDGGPVLIMMLGDGAASSLFLFCRDRLAAFSAPITPNVAVAILRPLTQPGTDITIFPHETGIWFETADRTVSVDYRGVGSKTSTIMASYPQEVLLTFNYAVRCDELAAN